MVDLALHHRETPDRPSFAHVVTRKRRIDGRSRSPDPPGDGSPRNCGPLHRSERRSPRDPGLENFAGVDQPSF